MSSRVEQLKKLVMDMTVEEIMEVNKWIFDVFNASDQEKTWDDAVHDAMDALKCLTSKPN